LWSDHSKKRYSTEQDFTVVLLVFKIGNKAESNNNNNNNNYEDTTRQGEDINFIFDGKNIILRKSTASEMLFFTTRK